MSANFSLHENIEKFKNLSKRKAFDLVGQIIDVAQDTSDSALTTKAFDLLDQLQARKLRSVEAALLHYFRANAWENRLHEAGAKQTWSWQSEYHQRQLLELRRAVGHSGFSSLDKVRRSQILTNLANNLNTFGRAIEALETWDRVIADCPNFAMANGNRGNGLMEYSKALYDPGHSACLYYAAIQAFKAGSKESAFFESPGSDPTRCQFASLAETLSQVIDTSAVEDVMNDSVHENNLNSMPDEERQYRRWVLKERLFLNPLNDLGEVTIATQDIMTLPSMTVSTGVASARPPAIFGMFNQMKQEFASARFLLFEGLQEREPHYSDKGVLLCNTLDYPSHSLAVEKIRAAFRLSYSLFDKIAHLLNHHFDLGHPVNRVSFRNVWQEPKGKAPRPLHSFFEDRPNWPLRGLYWLSKDLFEPEFVEVTNPKAREIAALRNHLEHKYLQVHESWAVSGLPEEEWDSAVGFHISRTDFQERAVSLLKLARAALIYLSLAIHREEQIRHSDVDDNLIVPVHLDDWDDEWKR